MPSYKIIMFDLDGTLADSQLGITRSVRHAFERLGIAADDPGLFRRFIGPPLHESFQRYCGLDDEGAIRAVAYYREYYAETGIFECSLYPGIPGLLDRIHDDGRVLALATSKPTVYAERVLAHFGLRPLFSTVAGGNMDGTGVIKADLISRVLSDHPGTPRDHAVMVGDREYDIIGARANNISSIAVTYGYGALPELTAAGPDYLAHSTGEIAPLVGLHEPRHTEQRIPDIPEVSE